MVKLSVIIVTYNSEAEIAACLASLFREIAEIPHEVLVVDNHSRDRTCDLVRRQFPQVKLIANGFNAGFPAANNQAIAESSGSLLLLLNPDTVVPAGSVTRLVLEMDRHPTLGICGPRLVDAGGEVAPDLRLPTLPGRVGDVFLGSLFRRKQLPAARIHVLSGAALMIRRALVDAIGLLDDQMFWREDADYCYRARKAGHDVRLVPEATVVHLVGRSAASNMEVALEKPVSSEIAFFMKHHGRTAAALVTFLLAFQTSLRLLKWAGILALRGSSVARQRVGAFRAILRRLPTYLRDSALRYPVRSSAVRVKRRIG